MCQDWHHIDIIPPLYTKGENINVSHSLAIVGLIHIARTSVMNNTINREVNASYNKPAH